MDVYERDRGILLREFRGALPALHLRPLLTHLGIRVIPTTIAGVALANPTTKTITMPADSMAWKGPFAGEVREYTSALAWGFAHIRLAELDGEHDPRAYAAAFLCPLELLEVAPELEHIRRGSGVEGLARRLAVATWVLERALLEHQLVERILKEVDCGGTDTNTKTRPGGQPVQGGWAVGGAPKAAGPLPEARIQTIDRLEGRRH